MKKITFLVAFLVTMSWQVSAQFGCGSGVVLTNGYTQSNITTPGTGGAEDWNTNPTGTSVSGFYWDDDVYMFEYTAGATAEQISMTIFTRNSWNGIGIFDDCNGTTFSNDLDAVSTTSSNVSQTVSATISAGNTVYIAVGQYGTPNDLDFDVTSFTVTSISCPEPTTLAAGSLTSNAASLSWTEMGTASTWEIEWDTAGFTQGAGTAVMAMSNPFSLTGLSANTSYEFYVRAACGANDSSAWVGPFSFNTACNALAVPFTEGFNSTSATLSCWTVLNNNSDFDEWGTYTFNPFEGDQSMTINTDFNNGSNDDYLISPSLILTGNERLKFQYRAQSANEPNDFQVLVSTSGTNASDFTDTISVDTASSTSYSQKVLDLSAYSGNVNIAIHIPNGGLDGWRLYIDEFIVEAIPSCMEPNTLAATLETTSGADLYWNETGTASLWDLEIVTTGATPTGTPTIAGVTADSVTISTLSSSTTYDYYVRADCGSGSTSPWSGPFTFTTSCAAVATFSENFDGVSSPNMPNCWGNLYFASNTFANVQTNNSTINANSGTNSVRFYNSSDLNPTWMLVSPELTNLSAGTHQTAFYAKDVDSNPIIVGTMSDPLDTATFTAFDTITTSSTYQEYIVSFASYTGADNYIAYRSVPNATYDYTYMDDISWETIPSCPKPSDLMVDMVSNTSATLSWTENGTATAWEIEIDTVGFTTGTGTIVSVNSNPSMISNLSANTSYEYYLRSVCGVGDSSVWVGPMSFTTLSDTIVTFPFANDLESGLGLYLGLRDSAESAAFVDVDAANASNFGIKLTGKAFSGWVGGSTTTTETEAFVDNSTHISGIDMIVDATALTSLTLKFDLKQTYTYGANYSWTRVLVNGVKVGNAYTPTTDDTDPFDTLSFDLSAYVGSVINVTIEHSGKYDNANGTGGRGDNAYVDNINLYQSVLASAVVDNNVTCNGNTDGGVTASAINGTSPYTYAWSNGATTASITGLAAGTYTVIVTDSVGDNSTAMVTITEPAAIAVNLGNDTSVCLNASLTLDAGVFTSYLWDDASTMQTRATVNTAIAVTNYSVTVTDANSCTGVDTIAVTVLADPIVDLGNDTSICDGTSLTLDAGSFSTYVWDDASSTQTRVVSYVLGATTYSVSVTNAAGCSGSDSIVVTGYAPVVVSLGNDTSICDGATLSLDAGTHTTYTWDDSSASQTRVVAYVLGATTYGVTVTDAAGCQGSDDIVVTGSIMPIVDLGNDTAVCDGETITLDAGAFTSYLWDDASTMQTRMTVSTLGAVDYSVEVTDTNGCLAADTIEVTGLAPVMVDLGGDTSLCNGAPYTLDAGAGFASYFWNNGFNTQTLDVSSTTSGTSSYVVIVEDSDGCVGRDSATISVKDSVIVDLGADTNIWADGVDTYTLDAGAGFSSYLWSDNITTTQTYEVKRATEGLVSVIVEDADGCEGTDTVRVTFAPVGVNDFAASTLTMYPNPAVDQVTVELSNLENVSNVNVTFLSVTGQVVLVKNIAVKGANSVETFDVSSLATGTYLVQFEANGNVVTKQFVIK